MLARLNLLSNLVDGLRATMTHQAGSHLGLGLDAAVGLAMLAILVAFAARLYRDPAH